MPYMVARIIASNMKLLSENHRREFLNPLISKKPRTAYSIVWRNLSKKGILISINTDFGNDDKIKIKTR